MKSFSVLILLAILCAGCGGVEIENPYTYDCGKSCVAECAFAKEWDKKACVDSCAVCDGLPQPNFTDEPNVGKGQPGWERDSPGPAGTFSFHAVKDAGAD